MHYKGHDLVTDLERTIGVDASSDEGYAVKSPDGSLIPTTTDNYGYRIEDVWAEEAHLAMMRWVDQQSL